MLVMNGIEQNWLTRGFFQALAEVMRNHSDRAPLVAEIVRDVLTDHGLGIAQMREVCLEPFDERELLKLFPGETGAIVAQVNPVHVSLQELICRLEARPE
jgi:hypothetical protein